MIPLLALAVVSCRSHKEADTRVAETIQTQTAEMTHSRSNSRAEAQTERTERADSIAWEVSADSVVQTKADGTREVLHRVRWTRTTYRPTATAKATMTAQRTDTTSAVVAEQSHRQTAVATHSESSRGGKPWLPWIAMATAVGGFVFIIYRRNRNE